MDYLGKDETIADLYLHRYSIFKNLYFAPKNIVFHHINVPALSSEVVVANLVDLEFPLVRHPPTLQRWLPGIIACSSIRQNFWQEEDFFPHELFQPSS